ncbi:hypothetical protein Tco_0920115, partial [Tanacetum coccineum]
MALPPRDQRQPFLRFQGLEYTDVDITDFEGRLGKIYDKGVHRMLVLDFEGLAAEMAKGLSTRMLIWIIHQEFLNHQRALIKRIEQFAD